LERFSAKIYIKTLKFVYGNAPTQSILSVKYNAVEKVYLKTILNFDIASQVDRDIFIKKYE
jgi:hypothetical protein